jgi:Sulfate permease family
MLGLTKLGRAAHPETTLDKVFFLFHHAFNHFHPHTTVISFTALLVLVFCRNFKSLFKKYWWIYRMPEVLIIVIASTGAYHSERNCVNATDEYTGYFLVLSAKLRWDEEGVDILGSVPINTGSSFFQFPISSRNLKHIRRTTSTAVYVSKEFNCLLI